MSNTWTIYKVEVLEDAKLNLKVFCSITVFSAPVFKKLLTEN